MFAKYKKIMMALTLFASAASVNADVVPSGSEWCDLQVNEVNRHPEQMKKAPFTCLSLDAAMTGVGGIDSWTSNAEALPRYRVDYQDRTFTLTIIPQP